MINKIIASFSIVLALTSTATPMGFALREAVRKNDAQQLRSLLANNNVDINAQDPRGWTPLHHAAYWDRVECVKVLLNAGADITAINNEGVTAKYLAVEEGNYTIIGLLQDYENTPDIKEPEGL
ncbi:ankyrin repeat domain-containing protein [bacterium]|nr:MAG: ankyrin repeat domain-containing protein [bacterium]